MIELNVTNLVGGNIVITTSSSGGGEEPSYHAETLYKYDTNSNWLSESIVGDISGNPPMGGPPEGTYQIPNVEETVEIELGADVTSIGDYTFFNCYRLTRLLIPKSVTRINFNAFLSLSCNIIFYGRTLSEI